MIIFGHFESFLALQILIWGQQVSWNSSWVLKLTRLNSQWVCIALHMKKITIKRGLMVILSQFGQFLAIFSRFFPTNFFSNVHGKVPMRSEKPTDIVAMLRHFFRVTAVKEGCGPSSQPQNNNPERIGFSLSRVRRQRNQSGRELLLLSVIH